MKNRKYPGAVLAIVSKQERIEALVHDLLVEINEDPNRTGLKDTPTRVAKMYSDIFRGYDESQKPKLTAFPNDDDGVSFKGIIKDEGYFFSHCEHHMVPFFGHFYFGYIPNKSLIGASKIGRLINFHSAKLQIAERLCRVVMDDFMEVFEPKGAILIMKARHLCKEMRGLKMFDSPFEVDDARGCFLENDAGCKTEFISRCKI
ncbi:MAG: GTP cyclohydrolase I [Deltaproteobacteria bacterium]|nr:GTP cyclohydrolase I [Deltaproteobacteria bacterium]